MKELSSLKLSGQHKWYLLGLQLGLDVDILDQIEEKYQDDEQMRLSKMFGAWMRSDKDPSWTKVCEALKNIGEDKLVNKIWYEI